MSLIQISKAWKIDLLHVVLREVPGEVSIHFDRKVEARIIHKLHITEGTIGPKLINQVMEINRNLRFKSTSK